MKQKNFWKSKLFLTLLVLGAFGLLTRNQTEFPWLQKVFQSVAIPFQEIGTVVGYNTSSITRFFGDVNRLKTENADLQKKNLELAAKVASLEQLGNENEELKRNLKLLPEGGKELLPAAVIARDPSGLQSFLTLDKGSEDGVSVGMPIVVEAGVLIGRVEKVSAKSATVVLITSQESVINAETSTGAVRGVVRGEHGLSMKLDMVEQGKELRDGEGVVTSGLGGEYPRGLLLGTLSAIGYSDDKLFQQATITSPVKINEVRFVFLVQKR